MLVCDAIADDILSEPPGRPSRAKKPAAPGLRHDAAGFTASHLGKGGQPGWRTTIRRGSVMSSIA